jgi:WD40 repeat protein
MTRDRALRDPVTGEIFVTSLDGNVVKIRSGKPGKVREREKPLADPAAALTYTAREEFKRLKDGFILFAPEAPAGAPKLHKSVTKNDTGALALTNVDDTLACNAFDPQFDSDTVRFVGRDGSDLNRIQMKPALVWKLEYIHDLRQVLMRADHAIMCWSLSEQSLTVLCPFNHHIVSFLSTAGTRAAWYRDSDVVVVDLQTRRQLLRISVEPEYRGGQSILRGALSPKGDLLALQSRSDEVSVLDVASGEIVIKCGGDFYNIDVFQFSVDGRFLMIRHLEYGRLLCFELSTGDSPHDLSPFGNLFTRAFALDPTGRRLAVACYKTIAIYDFASMTKTIEFPLEFYNQRVTMTWFGRDLGVLTDVGCLSLYAIG